MGHTEENQTDEHDLRGSQTIPIIGTAKKELTEEELLSVTETFDQTASVDEGIIINEKVKILDANQTLAAMFGYKLPDIIGLTILELITPETRGIILKNILLKEQKPYEAIGLKKDGTTFPVKIQDKTLLYKDQMVKAMAIRTSAEHNQAEILQGLQQTNFELEEQVKQGSTQLRFANEQLRQEIDEHKHMEAEIIQRNRELLTLQSASAAITSSLDLHHVLNTVTREMVGLLEVGACTLFEWDQYLDSISLLSRYNHRDWEENEASQEILHLTDYPLKQQCVKEKRIKQMIISQPDIGPTEMAYMQQAGIGTLLLLPMIFREHVVGLVEIMDRQERTFKEHEVSLAQLLAGQAASAIENARLYVETEHRAKQLSVLHELDRAITTSLRVSDVYHALARHAIRLLPYHHMSIALVEEDTTRIDYIADDNKDAACLPKGTLIPLQNSTISWVIERKQPSLHHNIATGSHSVENKAWLAAGIQSVMIMPLRVMGQVIGTWNIGHNEVGAFTPDDLEIAQSIADQLAIAVQNARLYKQARQEINERQRVEAALQQERALLAQRVEERTAELATQYDRQATLAAIELAINQPRELQNLLDYIVQITEQILRIDGGAIIILWDSKKEAVSAYSATTPGQDTEEFVNHIRPEGGATRWIIDNRMSLVIPDSSQTTFSPNPVLAKYGINAFAGAPLLTKEDILGVLYVFDKEQRQYTDKDVDFMMAVANRAAVAITKVRLYEQLERANVELARAARLKDEFLAAMSHELRTPLAAVLGMAELLKEEVYGTINEQQTRAVSSIEDSGRHLLALINDILDLSKIEADKLELDIGLVSIEDVCQISLQFAKQAAHKKQLKIASSYDNTITTMQVDERRLKQILVNLLSNAVKFTPEGGKIGLDVTGDPDQQLVHFSVWDTGVGIAPEDMGRLFQPFVQLDSSLARQYTGTGLGLALVKRMAEMQNGTVSVESTVGQGSRFTVSLPWSGLSETNNNAKTTVAKAVPQQTTLSPEIDQEQKSRLTLPANRHPLILVAEDEEKVFNFVSGYLKSNNYQIIHAQNGIEALALAKTEKPDLVLMDVHMPDMNGLEAIRQLRSNPDPNLSAIPIIALTALAMSGDREQCLEAGANNYLSKPIHLSQLISMIQTLLNQNTAEEEI